MSDQYLGENLIFVISQPRSGSTLLQRVLAGHPDIESSAETWLMLHPVYAGRTSGIETEYGAEWAYLARNDFLEHYTDGPEVYDDAVRAFAKVLYGHALTRAGGKIFLDKTPRYIFIIEDLYRLFPRAKFIFLLRNPLAVLASELRSHVKGDWPMLSVFRPDLLLAPGKIIDGMALLGERAIVMRYEDFVSGPEKQLDEICRKLEISFHPDMLEYGDTPEARGFMRDRVGIEQHSRPTGDSLDKWRHMLTDPQELHFAQSYLITLGSETLTALGYSWDELMDEVRHAAERLPRNSRVFPWSIAIRPARTWSLREKLQVYFFKKVDEHGRLLGTLKGVAGVLVALLRWLRRAFSRAASPG